MATFSFFSLASFHNRNSLFYHRPRHQQPQLLFVSHLKTKKNDFVCFACSIKQTRVRKRVKSNEELRSEILEFVALAGLPQGHVPSMKELCAHERVDLANVVRRRGYKFIRELLANSDTQYRNELTSASDICSKDSLKERQDEEALDENLSTEPPSLASISLDQKTNNLPEEVDIANSSSEDEQEYASMSKDDSSLAAVSCTEHSISYLGDGNHSAEITESYSKIESVELGSIADIESSSSEASVSENHSLLLDDTSSCSDRQVSNVSLAEDKGVSDVDQDSSLTYDHYTSQHLNYTTNIGISTESLSGFTSENFQNQQIDDTAENRSGSADDSLVESDDKDWTLGPSSSTSSIEKKTTRFIHNGYLDKVDDDNENDTPNGSRPEETKESAETIKGGEYNRGGQRSLSTAPNGSAVALEEVTYATEVSSSDKNSDQREGNSELDKDSHDETMKRENQVELTRLRFMLRQKELELSRLKEQIEKEKLSLSVLQRKAETEIQKAQILVSEKDVELQEAEGSLSGLQEVEIKYCGDGNVVEVTGSFNGWEHRVGLELEASKSTGKQKCWSTSLWLYPGTYEIKFIVDGQWTTDPKRDLVTRGHITNNILRVDR